MKQFKRAAALVLALCMIFALSACSSKPKASDAEKYVKACLDIICTGEYDHSVNLVDADEMGNAIDDAIDEALDTLTQGADVDEDIRQQFRDAMKDLFSKSRYTVGEATAVEDGFDVPVTIEPIDISERVTEEINNGLAAAMEENDLESMSEDELIALEMQVIVDALKSASADPEYGESVEVTVRYEELEDGVYGVSEADGEKLGAALFGSV